jgi:hypothetical protein
LDPAFGIKGVREITYNDLLHRYYIYDDNTQMYVHVLAYKKLDRLRTINIGDPARKLISIFGETYHQDGGEDILYSLNTGTSIIFFVRDALITGILYIINDF